MKKIFLLAILFISSINISLAYNYSDEEKNLFYDSFLEGYMEQISKSLSETDIIQEKKDKILNEFIKQTDRNELINSSWSCIKKYPITDIINASIVCTADWTAKQKEKQQKIIAKIKEEQ